MNYFKNPIIPGMAPDPSIIRVDDTYYIATSTFHWNPPIQIFESKDLVNWELIDYALKKEEVNLRGSNTPAGVWAPHLSYDAKTKRYWIIYSHMLNMAGREFNADNYAIYSDSIHGPWSEPIFLTSIGFDPSLFHDKDGKTYLSILEWETRQGYQAPGHIVIAEVDLKQGTVGDWHRICHGFTTRGCAEAPQLYKRNGYYYLVIAAGGTGYGHGVEIGRAKNIFGPYEPHPSGEPILTSSPRHLFSLGDPDAGHFEMFNPNSLMQKAGHGSLVETPSGEWYMAHLMSRPLQGALLNPLGRETALQKMVWTQDDWLVMADGSTLAKMEFEGITGVELKQKPNQDIEEHFNGAYDLRFMTPYRPQKSMWVNTNERAGYLRIYGENSFFSQNNPAIMATRATSFDYQIETKVEFSPDHYSETAGAGLYYDSNNWLYIHLTYSEEISGTILTVLQAKLGNRIEYPHHRISIPNNIAGLKIDYQLGKAKLSYKLDGDWMVLIEQVDVSYLSDEGVNGEPGEIGGFTGLFNFIGSVDAYQRDSYADFEYYKIKNN
ncbi:family 43 glycosylhydrolase [Testudinibacter aquarius]|uniref:Glycoside hydrolase family 43 protein n=1 Tax=Testudinibacter aquarius TaxID=1524974 RepID=A0A4R3YA48_9PAST|nr:family 43 glycosylhydrolase [Testudinibacter aquarius]KAE9528356.1 beta-xylosidase [Testudinibacter aquarius]TCV88806.1 xylan 1,4-beta-xylosidase [Testudinibacter aquarius]TNG90786.1 glycoside hydrolase family 43 protein [Testudinibacter aquarius]